MSTHSRPRLPAQELQGNFRLKLRGLPFIAATGILDLTTRKNNQARGWAIIIGPFILGFTSGRLRRQTTEK